MKVSPFLAAASLLAASFTASPARAGSGVVDLTTLANYANQPVPNYVTKRNTPNNNPITDRGATLGRVLFHDKRLSFDNTISCASCHQQAHAFGDTATASTGYAGTTGRHAMRLINARFGDGVRFFWDERAASLEAQTTQPIQNHVEMGFSGADGDPNFAFLVAKLTAIAEYRVLFSQTFGDAVITETRVQSALAQFVRSIQSFDSKFDAALTAANGNVGPAFPTFTGQENAGKARFLNPPPGGAGCAGCHRPPEFDIDPNSRNNGVITAIGTTVPDLTNTRSPSLRDLVGLNGQSHGGLMHDGSFATLNRVVDHYNAIPGDNANLDARLRRPGGAVQSLNLNQTQKDELVAFLRTLTGNAVYTDPRWSDPFNAQNQLSLIVLPASSVSMVNQGNGTMLVSTKAAPGLTYLLQSSPDLQTWTTVGTVVASASGVCAQSVSVGAAPTFYRYVFTPPAVP